MTRKKERKKERKKIEKERLKCTMKRKWGNIKVIKLDFKFVKLILEKLNVR